MNHTATTTSRAFGRGMIFEISYERAIPIPPLSTGDKVIVRLPNEGEMILDVVAVEKGRQWCERPSLGFAGRKDHSIKLLLAKCFVKKADDKKLV
jgi:hypothetical protein